MENGYHQLNEYNQYLEAQVDKFTAFMLSQKKLNEKHMELEHLFNSIVKKIQKVEQRFKIIQINESDHLLELKKIKAENHKFNTLELRLDNLQNDLNSFIKQEVDPMEPSHCESGGSYKKGEPANKKQFMRAQEKNKNYKNRFESFCQQKSKDRSKASSGNQPTDQHITKMEIEEIVSMAKDDLQFKIRKLQVESDKQKQGFLKLTSHLNSLTVLVNESKLYKKQHKSENKGLAQSTKDIIPTLINENTQNGITKKQLKRMEKKLQNFFSQKMSQMTGKLNKADNFSEENEAVKVTKFKKMQQKYQKMLTEQDDHITPKYVRQQNDRRHSSLKKVSLFDNQILRERHVDANSKNNTYHDKKKKGSNLKSRKKYGQQLAYIDSPKYSQRSNSNNKLSFKKISQNQKDKIKKVHNDYLLG